MSAPISRDELRHLMDVLLDKRIELHSRVNAIRADIGNRLSPDFSDQGIELENADVLNELSREAIEELGRINLALQRIEAGTYGQCSDCGCEIEIKRLESVPWALRCLSCENKRGSQAVSDRSGERKRFRR
ncbi:MAG: TraR/DksA family transcriptional regulator [Pseudomonadota bacterium]